MRASVEMPNERHDALRMIFGHAWLTILVVIPYIISVPFAGTHFLVNIIIVLCPIISYGTL